MIPSMISCVTTQTFGDLKLDVHRRIFRAKNIRCHRTIGIILPMVLINKITELMFSFGKFNFYFPIAVFLFFATDFASGREI
jgi:hypothetical protein